MQGQQRFCRQALPVIKAVNEIPGQPAQTILVLGQQSCRAPHSHMEAWIQFPQHRDHPVADAVAAVIVALIAAVLHMGDSVFLQIVLNFPSRDAQQGADDFPPAGRDPAQSQGAGAPGQVQQHRLHIVVPVVGGGDIVAALLLCRLLQETVAQRPGRFLQAQPLCGGVARGVPMAGDAGDALFPAPALHKGGVPQGFLPPDAVLKMSGHHIPAPAVQQVQQAHGVRPAGHSAENPPLPGQRKAIHRPPCAFPRS